MLKVSPRSLVAAATIWCALTQDAGTGYARSGDLAEPSLPRVVQADGKVLALNGTGIGTKILVHVYVVGLYLEKKTTDARAAIKTNEAKCIAMVMLRKVSREQFVNAVEKGMVRESGLPIATLRSRLDLLEGALPALEKGDMVDFTYLPGVGTVVRGKGREMKIPGKDFADALFSVWLGPYADNSSLRHELLGGE